MFTEFGSIITAAVTPMRPSGEVDYDGFRLLLDHLVSTGSDGVVVCGTTGESPTVTDDEKLKLFAIAVEVLRDRPARNCSRPHWQFSNDVTAGPAASGCLGTQEAAIQGGMPCNASLCCC